MQYAHKSYTNNKLTPEEKKRLEIVWDGKTSKGWKGAEIDFFPESGITLEMEYSFSSS